VRLVSSEEASRLPLRKPPARGGQLRLIEVEGVDLSACGGTHVPSTGAIGLIAVTAWERFKGGTRVSFACGARALSSHRRLRDVVTGATRALSVSPGEIGGQIERLQQAARDADRRAAAFQEELAGCQAREWSDQAETIRGLRVVLRHVPAADAAVLKKLAHAVVATPGVVAALVGVGDPVPVVVARGEGVPVDAGAVVRAVTVALGGRGGGRAELAQAGVPAAPGEIVTFLRQALGS
jgi:alanyl-tRNA synthetase